MHGPEALAPPSAPPVFIVGCGRSGTTWLRLMLDSHPELAIPGETHFLMALWKRRNRYRTDGRMDADLLVRDLMRSHQFRYWDLPEEAVWRRVRALADPTFGDAVGAVYMAYADVHGKRRWGDKTPQYVRSMTELSTIFPGARFVHVIRDGRDVASSYLGLDWGPSDVWKAAKMWRNDVTAGRSAGRVLGPQRYLEVRYEQLTSDPVEALARVCAFLDLPFDARMLDYHQSAEERIEARPDRVVSHASATRPPAGQLRDWRTQLPPDQVMTFEAIAGPVLTDLGYERRFERIPFIRIVTDVVRSRWVKPHLPRRPRIRTQPRNVLLAGRASERPSERASTEGTGDGD